MVQLEKRLLWHPRGKNKFVVGGNAQIILYEWASQYPEIKHVTSQNDLQFMKCFAWSPDPHFDDLVAIGLSTGKVDLLRLESSKQAQRRNVLASGPSVTLPVRSNRACTALAFNNVDPNYLAVGLEKVRGDSSLVIWDISSAAPALNLSVPSNVDPSYLVDSSALRSRPHPLIPRLESQARLDPRILQQHAMTEVVPALSFLPDSTHLLLASISNRWLRFFDLRYPQQPVVNVGCKVQGIATDPFDPHRVACFGDNIVSVWDARKLAQPLLMFTERDAIGDGAKTRPGSAFVDVEFSSSRRGCLATLEKDSSYVRFWDISETRVGPTDGSAMGGHSSDGERSMKDSVRMPRRSWAATLPWPTAERQPQSPKEKDMWAADVGQKSFFLADTRRTKYFKSSLASFALAPTSKSHPLTSNVMVVNKDGDLELYAVYDTPKQAIWSSKGDLAMGAGTNLKVFYGYDDQSDALSLFPEFSNGMAPTYEYPQLDPHIKAQPVPSRDASEARGRSAQPSNAPMPTPMSGSAPMFGRGDEDGFPALTQTSTPQPTGLSATRPDRQRVYSPVSTRKQKNDRGGQSNMDGRRSLSRTDTVLNDDAELTDQDESRGSSSKKKPEVKKTGIAAVVQDDISMVMRRRALGAYGLSRPQMNASVTREVPQFDTSANQMLSDIWSWIYYSEEFLAIPPSMVEGYDFSWQGLLGIWEGLPAYAFVSTQPIAEELGRAQRSSLLLDPTYGGGQEREGRTRGEGHQTSWFKALSTLVSRGGERPTWKPTFSTNKLLQRQVALRICGWSSPEEEVANATLRWEQDGQISRAACWLVFMRQYGKAIDVLLASDDDVYKMMSGAIAFLSSSSTSSKAQELRDHYSRLTFKLDDVYFRVMLSHLTGADGADILDEENIPLPERLAFALMFLDDKAISSNFHRLLNHSIQKGHIDALILTGLTPSGMALLQSYVNFTGDVQTAAILSSYVCPHKFRDMRAERWLDAYRDLLDGFKLHHHRVGFDIERGQLLQDAFHDSHATGPLVPPQIIIRCHYCNKPVVNRNKEGSGQKTKPTACDNCNRELPRCSVCLMTLSILHDASREVELAYSHERYTFEDAIVICQTCRHGGHAMHILEWFLDEDERRRHRVCPVADCNCPCADDF